MTIEAVAVWPAGGGLVEGPADKVAVVAGGSWLVGGGRGA